MLVFVQSMSAIDLVGLLEEDEVLDLLVIAFFLQRSDCSNVHMCYYHLNNNSISEVLFSAGPENTRRSSNATLMLAQRRRRWSNIQAALDERSALTGGFV